MPLQLRYRLRERFVRALAHRRGQTLGELAADAGITPSRLSKLLLDHEYPPGARVRRRMCARLGVAHDELFDTLLIHQELAI